MKLLVVMLLFCLSAQSAEIVHSNCSLKFFDHKMIEDLEVLTGLELDRALERNGFSLEINNGNASGAVSRSRDLMVQDDLIGIFNIRVKYNNVSFWEQVAGKKKKIIFAAIRYRVEQLNNNDEERLFNEVDSVTVTGDSMEEAYRKLFPLLPHCKIESIIENEPVVEVEPIAENQPVVENEPVVEAESEVEPVVELNEPGCRCYSGETSDTHLCHNYGVADKPTFYFIHCKNGKPVYDSNKPGWWLLTKRTSCDVYPDCCDSYKYNDLIEGLGIKTSKFCIQLANSFGS